ncbi:uncharacterized protein LOC141904529 [Tubulanus polymorphus]|uniref:uncharacterized protein LOC141904529 n=1 Tax=Tubulanus polymorphus TaxID=672921 RepID=UPI003DA5C22E
MIQRITATATEALLILLIITTRFINASEVGCYTIWNGTTDTRLLTTSPGFYLTSQILTSSECQLHCAQCSFTHASLEGDFCMCGEVSTLIESMNKNCTQLCADDNSTCGNYVTVYTTPNVVKGLVITQPATGANIEAFVETVYVDVNVTLGADVTYTYDFGDGYVATTNNSHTTHVFRSRGGSKGITVKASTPEMIQPVTASTVVQVESSIKDLQVICPRFVELNATFECIFQLKQGTDIRLHIDFDDGRYFPFTPADSFPYEVGSVQSTAGPTGTVASASMHFLKSHFLRHNGSVVAVEVTLKTAGNVTFELYRPYCQEATAEFCVHLNRCINSTNQCRPVTGKIRCSGDTIYSFRLRTCVFKGNGTVAPHDDQTLGNPPNYRFIDRWSFEVNESGLYYYAMPRTVDIQAGDVPVIGAGSTMEISTFSTSHSATAAFTPNTGDSAYIDRNTTNYIVNQTDMTSHNFDFFVKFYVMRPAITKITHRYAAALGETNFTVSANASNVITNKTVTDSMKIEILVKISNFTLLCEDKGRTHWDFNFTIPEHPGTSPVYSWDFGDGNQANSTELVYIYRYLLPGFYTVTVTARNELNQQSITRNLTVQDTISHVSVDVNDQPATLFGQATTIIVSGTEGSDGIYQLHFGDGSQTQAGLGLFNETHSHQSYFTVSQGRTITESLKQTSINTVDVEVCAKACLTYSQFQCKSFVIDSVQCVLRDVGVAELEASKLEHNKPGTSLYLLKGDKQRINAIPFIWGINVNAYEN